MLLQLALGQKFMYLDYSTVDQIFGLERVEELLSRYSYISINLESFCQGVDWQNIQSVKEEKPPEVVRNADMSPGHGLRAENDQSVTPLMNSEDVFVPKTVLEAEKEKERLPEIETTTAENIFDENDRQVVNILHGGQVKLESQEKPLDVPEEEKPKESKKDKSKEKDEGKKTSNFQLTN